MNDQNKKIHIVSFDIPYPPNYGGIIDVFYKIKTLFELGYEMARAVYQGDVWADTSIVPAPHTDSMGYDMIVYWPGAKVQETEEVEEWS